MGFQFFIMLSIATMSIKAYFSRIRPLKVSPLTDPERVQKSWGFFAFRDLKRSGLQIRSDSDFGIPTDIPTECRDSALPPLSTRPGLILTGPREGLSLHDMHTKAPKPIHVSQDVYTKRPFPIHVLPQLK